MSENLERISHNGQLMAIVVRNEYDKDGISFFTPNEFSQQLAYMKHPAGHKIAAHEHNIRMREVYTTQEVLIIRKGKIKVTFYDDDHREVATTVIKTGDVIMLVHGGHGFEILEPTEFLEVKQGPFDAEMDKVKFEPKGQDSTE